MNLNVLKFCSNNKVKWAANGGFVLSTLLMISPDMASKSVLPWIVYLLANAIWLGDSIYHKNKPWIWLAGFFVVWDTILVISRII